MAPDLNRIYLGDNRETLRGWPDACVDAVVTDPPYELGFMGKSWDASGIAYDVGLWKEVLRVMKPGAHLLAFGGTRTYHRMASAIEDAGFEVRDQLQWLYGSGFPKSMNVAIAIDKSKGASARSKAFNMKGRGQRAEELDGNGRVFLGKYECKSEEAKTWDGWGTALKPANEPIVLARKPCSEKTVAANVLKWGTGALNIDASRIPGGEGGEREGEDSAERRYADKGSTDFAMKPGPRGGDAKGRWPANLIVMHHPHCIETPSGHACVADCPMRIMDDQAGHLVSGKPCGIKTGGQGNAFGHFAGGIPVTGYGDSGGASRFFYCPKPDGGERNMGLDGSPQEVSPKNGAGKRLTVGGSKEVAMPRGNHHPTVKPVDLMAYLIKLVTPRGGVVLDPFMGSGTTAIAAARLGFPYLGCEMSAEYLALAEKRVLAETDGKLL